MKFDSEISEYRRQYYWQNDDNITDKTTQYYPHNAAHIHAK